MDRTKLYRKQPNSSINSSLSASNSNLTNITPSNKNTPKNSNTRSKSNLNFKESDAVRRLKSKYNIPKIIINSKELDVMFNIMS